jgi:hypothetical protein
MRDVRLPAELLIKILALATSVPSELNTEGITLFKRCGHKEAIKERQMVMKTRRTLPRVSKYFYVLSIEFLYQSISVLRGTTLYYLRRTLQSGSGQAGNISDGSSKETCSHFGRWVKRLDIVFYRRKYPHNLSEDTLQLLPFLPRLKILTFHGNEFVPEAKILLDSIGSLHELQILQLPPQLPVGYASKLSTRLVSPESLFFNLRIPESNILRRIRAPEEFKKLEEGIDHPILPLFPATIYSGWTHITSGQ